MQTLLPRDFWHHSVVFIVADMKSRITEILSCEVISVVCQIFNTAGCQSKGNTDYHYKFTQWIFFVNIGFIFPSEYWISELAGEKFWKQTDFISWFLFNKEKGVVITDVQYHFSYPLKASDGSMQST